MPLKYVDKSSGAVTLAFCPLHPGQNGAAASLLAAGTVAGAVDVNFSSSSQLELFALDFATSGDTPPVVGSVVAPERFHRLAWSQRPAGDPTSPSLGLIAGGLADGSVCVWDPAAILARGEGRQPLLSRMHKHSGAVKGLEFNPFAPNMLVSGGADSELTIWDLANPSKPQVYPPMQVGGAEVQHASWNRKVHHILASCLSNGTTVVWDLKKQKPVISFRDPNSHRRASVLQWNPEVATQMVVASDDDRSPTLQMWDLRNSVSPVKEFVGHSKGVLGMAWCPHDPALLLSCGKDGRNICWDVPGADIAAELPASRSWNFDIAWAPASRGVFATACFDGLVGVHNLLEGSGTRVVETINPDFSVSRTTTGSAVPLKRVPAWLKRPAGVAFGFGGKLVSLVNERSDGVDVTGQPVPRTVGVIRISQVITEPELVSRSEGFETAIAGGDKGSLYEYCAAKAATLPPNAIEEAETWTFLSLLFTEADGRRELLKRLGFQDVLAHDPASASGGAGENGDALGYGGDSLALGNDGRQQGSLGGVAANGVGADGYWGEQDDDPDFFDKLPEEGLHATSSPTKSPRSLLGAKPLAGDGEGGLVGRPSHIPDAGPDGSHELEDDIQRAIIAGNYESAVESCFKAHRLADALLIANIFNSELYKRTMHRYMKLCPKPYMAIIRATVDADFEALVRARPVAQWRETLALLATYTAQDEWSKFCDVLAGRLAASGMTHAALLCHICAGNLEGAVSHWVRTVGGSPKAVEQLQSVIEKSVVMGMATSGAKASAALSDLVTAYAGLLAAQGRLGTALDYLDYAPGEASTTVAELRDRIYRSGGVAPEAWQARGAPPFPFVMEDVKVALTQEAPVAAHSAYPGSPAASTYSTGGAYSAYGAAVSPHKGVYAASSAYSPYGAAPSAQPAYSGGYGAATAQQAASAHQAYAQPQPAAGFYNPATAAAQQYGGAGQGGYGTQSAQPPPQQAPPPPQQQPSYGAGGYATPQFAPTTTSAGSHFVTKMQAAAPQPVAAPPQQQSAVSYGAGAGGYGGDSGAAAAVYQTKRGPPNAPPPVAAPGPNAYTAAVADPAASVTAAAGYGAGTAVAGGGPVGSAQNFFVPAPGGPPGIGPPAVGGPQGVGITGGPGGAATAAPRAVAPPPPAAPAGPPPNITVATADTSKVPPEHRPIVVSLTNLYNSCAAMATNPAKKREMEDNSRKVGQLFWKLGAGEVSPTVLPKLAALCAAVDAGDWHQASHIQVDMTTADWTECGFWLSAVKRLIKMRQMGG